MIAASINPETGQHRLYLGLERANIARLLNDQPILRKLDGSDDFAPAVPGLEAWEIVIMGPEDMARFVAHVQFDVRPNG